MQDSTIINHQLSLRVQTYSFPPDYSEGQEQYVVALIELLKYIRLGL